MKGVIFIRMWIACIFAVFGASRPIFCDTNHAGANSNSNYYVGEGELASLSYEAVQKEATIYITHKATGEPYFDAKIYVHEQKEGKEPLAATGTNKPGIYKFTLPGEEFIPSEITVQTSEDVDTVELSIPAYKKQAAPAELNKPYPIRSKALLFGIILASIVSVMFAYYFIRRRQLKIVAQVLLAAVFVSFPTRCTQTAYAHGGEDHGGSKPVVEESTAGSDTILSKKSQFLIELRTIEVKPSFANSVIKSFGHIIPPPQNDAHIIAPQPGYLKVSQNLTLGKKIHRGDTLAFIQTVNQIAITSPIDGVLSEISAFNGARIEVGSKLFRVINPETLWVDAELFSNQITRLADVSKVFVAIEGVEKSIEAKILNASTPISEDTRTAKVFLELQKSESPPKVGTFVDVFFELKSQKAEKSFAVPKSAILNRGGESVVFVQTGSESFAVRTVITEENARPGFESVTRGLLEGERVVVVGGYQLLMKAK